MHTGTQAPRQGLGLQQRAAANVPRVLWRTEVRAPWLRVHSTTCHSPRPPLLGRHHHDQVRRALLERQPRRRGAAVACALEPFDRRSARGCCGTFPEGAQTEAGSSDLMGRIPRGVGSRWMTWMRGPPAWVRGGPLQFRAPLLSRTIFHSGGVCCTVLYIQYSCAWLDAVHLNYSHPPPFTMLCIYMHTYGRRRCPVNTMVMCEARGCERRALVRSDDAGHLRFSPPAPHSANPCALAEKAQDSGRHRL